MELIKPRYLGDAVYASFDGHHICLHLNSHESEPLIYLEQEVFQQLCEFADDLRVSIQAKAKYDREHEQPKES